MTSPEKRTSSRAREVGRLGGAFLSRTAPGIITFVGTPLIIRVYGPVDYGFFARFWAAGLMAVALVTSWQRQAIIRDAGLHSGRSVAVGHWITPLQAVIAALPLLGLAVLTPGEGPFLYLAVLMYAAALVVHSIRSAELQRDLKVTRIMVAETARATVTSICPLFLPTDFRSGTALLIFASFGIGVYLLVAQVSAVGLRRDRVSVDGWLANAWGYGWPLSIWQLLSTAVLYIDRFFALLFVGEYVAGQYSALSDFIVRGFGMIAMPVTFVAHAEIMKAANTKSPDEARNEIRRWSVIQSAWLTVCFLVFIPVSGGLSELVLGEAFTPSAVPLLLGTVAVLWQGAQIAHKPHETVGETRVMLIFMCGALVISITGQLVLGPSIGLLGVAAAAVGGPAAYLIGIWLTTKRALKLMSRRRWITGGTDSAGSRD